MQTITLGNNEVLPYVREVMERRHTLSLSILRNINIQQGVTRTLIPDRFLEQKEKLSQLRFGLDLSSAERNEIETANAQFILDFLQKDHQHTALFEEPLAALSDPGISLIDIPFVTLDQEIYYPLSDSEVSIPQIIKTVRYAFGIQFVGILTVAPQQINLAPSATLQIKDIDEMTTQAQHILVGAYDYDGILIWSRS